MIDESAISDLRWPVVTCSEIWNAPPNGSQNGRRPRRDRSSTMTNNSGNRVAVEARIKSLTTLIHFIRPQNGPPSSGNARSTNARAYHHVATLLTRGVEEVGAGHSVIAVTGAHTVTGATVTALSPDPGLPLHLPSIKTWPAFTWLKIHLPRNPRRSSKALKSNQIL
jgi:hypothetical protein